VTKKISLWILNHYAQAPDVPGGTRRYELAPKQFCPPLQQGASRPTQTTRTRDEPGKPPWNDYGGVHQTGGPPIEWIAVAIQNRELQPAKVAWRR